MQHDTSPHEVEVGGKKHKAQTASAVLCYSRLLFFQINPTFQRFDCKVFLTDALRYIGGAPRTRDDRQHPCGRVARDRARDDSRARDGGVRRTLRIRFVAHERGDANRSARVERPFSFIENNFLAGRTFTSWSDLNQQARQWCDKVNATYKKHIRAVPRELFAVERLHLKPLPAWIPEVYRLHQRTVDVEGYVSVHSIRYSVPVSWIGRRVEVRETKDKVEIELDARHIVTHRARPGAAAADHAGRTQTAARVKASREAIRTRKNKPFCKPRRRLPATWRNSSRRAAKWWLLPCGNCCGCCGSIRASRSWPRCAKPPNMASTIWTDWNG